MKVSNQLLREFAKVTNDTKKEPSSVYRYGEVHMEGKNAFVKLDGSDEMTPVDTSCHVDTGDRVMVLIGNHTATVTDNITNPGAGSKEVEQVTNFIANNLTAEHLDAKYATVQNLEAVSEKVGSIEAGQITTEQLDAKYAKIENLNATNERVGSLESTSVKTSDLEASNGRITKLESDTVKTVDLEANYTKTKDLDAKYATVENLTSNYSKTSELDAKFATINELHSDYTNTENLNATYAKISTLEADYAHVDLANVKNASITTAMIQEAAITQELVADSAIGDAQIANVSANKLYAGTLDASKVNVTNLNATNIKTGTLEVGGVKIDVSNGTAAVNGSALTDGTVPMSSLSEEVQNEIDGAIETWTATAVPTLSNSPASDWGTDSDKNKHIGDICYVVNDSITQNGYAYRFTKSSDGTFSWTLIKDSDVTNALKSIGDIQKFNEEVSSWQTNTDKELSSLKSKTTTIEGNLGEFTESKFNEVSQTVDTNTSSITTLQTNVKKAQDTADTNKTNITTVTNTVNTVKQTADTNKSNISTLTKTVNDNETDIENKYSSLTQTVNGVSSNVGTLTTKVNNLKIGGRNLWINAGRYTADTPYSTTSNSKDNYRSNFDGKVIYSSIKIPKGTKVLLQGVSNLPWTNVHDTSGNNKNKVGYWIYETAKQNTDTYTKATFIEGDNTTKFSGSYTTTSDCYLTFRFNTYSDGTDPVTGKFWNIKAELGNIQTDWSPAPEDFQTQITSNTSRIDQTATAITSKVSKTDFNGQNVVSLINQSADNVTIAANKIDLKGAVTISDLDSNAQSEIRNAKIAADGVLEKANKRAFNGVDIYIHSSEGTVFKNSDISTVMAVTVFHGSFAITNQSQLENEFGTGSRLQWSMKRYSDDDFSAIDSTDSRLSDNGFRLTVSPNDVDRYGIFTVELNAAG